MIVMLANADHATPVKILQIFDHNCLMEAIHE